MERELRAKLEEVGPGVDVQTVHFSSVRQAEQRDNEEEHGAKRGVRGLYKLGQRVLTVVTLSAHRFQPLLTHAAAWGRMRMRSRFAQIFAHAHE